MSYSYVAEKSCANRSAILTELWVQLAAMGWSLHDDQNGSSYKVYKTTGETASRVPEYFKIDWLTANKIKFTHYLYWDENNQSGTSGSAVADTTYSVLPTDESGNVFWCYGNKNVVVLHNKTSTNNHYNFMFGIVKDRPAVIEATFTNTETLSNGTVVELESITGIFKVGNRYMVVSPTGRRDVVTCSAVTSNSVTIDTCTSSSPSYAAGSKIGTAPVTGFWVTGHTGTTIYMQGGSSLANIDSTYGTSDNTQTSYMYCSTVVNINDSGFIGGGSDPSYFNQYIMFPLAVVNWSNARFWGLLDTTVMGVSYNTGAVTNDTWTVDELHTGTAESGSSSTLVDTDQSWTTDALIDKVVTIVSGTGAGQIRKISDNDSTSITVSSNWATTPDTGRVYIISEKAYRHLTSAAYVHLCCQEGI